LQAKTLKQCNSVEPNYKKTFYLSMKEQCRQLCSLS